MSFAVAFRPQALAEIQSARVWYELSLGYRLESPEGAILATGTDKRKAGADGEDLMTPLVESAAEAIAAAGAKP